MSKKLFVLAVILSILVAGSVYLYLDHLQKTLDPRVYKEVVVAKENIPANTRVTLSMLEKKRLPSEYRHEEAVEDTSVVIGKITEVPIYKGEQVLKSRLVGTDSNRGGLSYRVPVGYRAVAVQVNEVSGVGYNLRPGDKVDVLATMDFKVGGQEITQTSIILQNIQVLALGRNLEKNGSSEKEIKTVTLAVGPLEARPLVLASERGSIRLLLRSPVDEKRESIPAMRVEDLLERR